MKRRSRYWNKTTDRFQDRPGLPLTKKTDGEVSRPAGPPSLRPVPPTSRETAAITAMYPAKDAPLSLTAKQRRAAEAARRKAKKEEAKALTAKQEAEAADSIFDHAGTWLKHGMDQRCREMCETDFGVGFQGYRRVKDTVKTWLEQLAEASAKRR